MAQSDSLYENHIELVGVTKDFENALGQLKGLGLPKRVRNLAVQHTSLLNKAKDIIEDLVLSGEEMLFYNKRLAVSKASSGFLHEHDILDHWTRYAKTGRIFYEIGRLIEAADRLLEGHRQQVNEDHEFLIDNLDLPDDLKRDFYTSRDLFSVGLDEPGLLFAGRGLEGVLRKIAELRGIKIAVKGKEAAVTDAGLYDLIETLYQVQWRTSKERLLSSQNRSLLHYVRELRNRTAHSSAALDDPLRNPREMATVIADASHHLWKQVTSTKARFTRSVIDKNW